MLLPQCQSRGCVGTTWELAAGGEGHHGGRMPAVGAAMTGNQGSPAGFACELNAGEAFTPEVVSQVPGRALLLDEGPIMSSWGSKEKWGTKLLLWTSSI